MAQTPKKNTAEALKSARPAAKPAQPATAKKQPSDNSFLDFMMRPDNLKELGIFFAAYLLLYAFVSSFYPDPLCLPDSIGYIGSSIRMTPNLFRPLGYSWFLKFLYSSSHTIDAVIRAQYWLGAISVLMLLYTVKYFYPSGRAIWFKILAACLIISPSVWYMNFWILSDGLFFTLTIIWLCSLLWIAERRSIPAMVIHILTLYSLIYVRHTGLIYPIMSCLVFIYSLRLQAWYLCILSIAALLIVVGQSKKANERAFGVNTFSGFSAWNQANNALSILPYVKVDTTQMQDPEVRMAHRIISKLPDSLFSAPSILSGGMIWHPQHSLQDVQNVLAKQYPEMNIQQVWFKTADVLGKYSGYLIKHYPGAYFTHFILPNAGEVFHFGEDHKLRAAPVFQITQGVFYQRYGIEKTSFTNESDIYDSVFNPLAGFIITFWLLLCIVAAVMASRTGVLKLSARQGRYAIAALLVFLVIYIGFSVAVSVIVYRYMYVVTFLLILLCYMLVRSIGSDQKAV